MRHSRLMTRDRIETALCAAGIYRPARNAYQFVRNRSHYLKRVQMRQFYGSLIPPRALVFDIGANQGRLSEEFLRLGHRVVAVEPNPELAATIRRRYRRVIVEQAAIGAAAGTATLRVGRHDGHSTISDEWAATGPDRYTGTVDVPVTTVRELVARHGMPAFVKIDVEGYEPEVLTGMDCRVGLISFEYQCAAPHLAERCLDRLEQLGYAQFARSEGEDHVSVEWAGRAAVSREIATHASLHPESYGDIYAR